jgi:hypothetical protein
MSNQGKKERKKEGQKKKKEEEKTNPKCGNLFTPKAFRGDRWYRYRMHTDK